MKNFTFKSSLKKSAIASSLIVVGGLSSISNAASQHDMHMADMPDMDHSQMQHDKSASTPNDPSPPKAKVTVSVNTNPHTGHEEHTGQSMPDIPQSTLQKIPDQSHDGHTPEQSSEDHHAGHDMSGMEMPSNNMQHQHGSSQSRENARSPDYSQGRGYGPLHPPHMMADDILYGVRVNSLEWTQDKDSNSNGFASSGSLWLGTDANRAVLDWDLAGKKQLDEASAQLVWRKPLATFWNYDVGLRTDYQREGADRQWLVANINGFAPYRFEVNATALVGDKSRTALKLDADYDLRITQRLVLQPEVSASLYGKTDKVLKRGAGLSDVSTTFRLRYDITRQFAPYIGFQYTRYAGKTADLLQDANRKDSKSQLMAGIRFWF